MYMMNSLFMLVVDFFLGVLFCAVILFALALVVYIFRKPLISLYYFAWSKVHNESYEYYQRRVGLKEKKENE